MAITKTYSFDDVTVKKLAEIVGSGNASETLRILIQKEWECIFCDGESVHAPKDESNPYRTETD